MNSGHPTRVALRDFASPALAPAPFAKHLEDVRLFLLGWTGGLVFFGTLFA